MASNLLQFLLDLDDPAPNPPSIHLQLRLAGAPGPNATSQPGQLAPMAGEAREQILELGQLDLELPLPRSGALGENIQNEPGPINHLSTKGGFEISLLGTGQVIVEDDEIHALLADRPDLLDLPRTDQGAGIGQEPLLEDAKGRRSPCRDRQLSQLLQGILGVPTGLVRPPEPDEDRHFTPW
jgi:hypothetical protein